MLLELACATAVFVNCHIGVLGNHASYCQESCVNLLKHCCGSNGLVEGQAGWMPRWSEPTLRTKVRLLSQMKEVPNNERQAVFLYLIWFVESTLKMSKVPSGHWHLVGICLNTL